MSECVVRMEMPKHCGECELKTWDIWPGSFKCVKTMHDIMSHIRNRTKPNDCPIICSIPDGHGRLVDIDRKFLRVATDGHGMSWNWRGSIADMIDEDNMRGVEIIVPADTAERSETK